MVNDIYMDRIETNIDLMLRLKKLCNYVIENLLKFLYNII